MVSHIEGRTQIEGIWEHAAEKNVWTQDVIWDWRKVYNDKPHNLYSLLNIIRMIKPRRMRWMEHVTCMREMRNVYNILVGNPKGRRPHRRPGYRWEDINKIEHMETGREIWTGFIWLKIGVGGVTLVNTT